MKSKIQYELQCIKFFRIFSDVNKVHIDLQEQKKTLQEQVYKKNGRLIFPADVLQMFLLQYKIHYFKHLKTIHNYKWMS